MTSALRIGEQSESPADPDPELPARLKAVESAVVSLATQHQNAHRVYRPLSTEICRLYNDNRCRFPKCRQLRYPQQSTVERQRGPIRPHHGSPNFTNNHIPVRLAVYPSLSLVMLDAVCASHINWQQKFNPYLANYRYQDSISIFIRPHLLLVAHKDSPVWVLISLAPDPPSPPSEDILTPWAGYCYGFC